MKKLNKTHTQILASSKQNVSIDSVSNAQPPVKEMKVNVFSIPFAC